MIGTDLSLSLPSLADTYSVAIAKVAVALQAIEDSIADLATPAALDITGNLSIGGNHLTNVGGLILVSGNSPTSAGSIYYSGGNFYAKDATGVIQLTSSGGINVAGIGAIGGDYGGVNPASVDYDDASGQYRFKEDASTWADGVFDDIILMETGGTDYVRLTAPASVTTTYTLTFPAAPPAETRPVTVASDGTVAFASAVTLPANGNFTVSGTGDYKHGELVDIFTIDACAAIVSGSFSVSIAGGFYTRDLSSSGHILIKIPRLRVGWRVKRISIYAASSADVASSPVVVQNFLGTPTTPSIAITGTFVSGGSLVLTLDTPHTVIGGDLVLVDMVVGAATTQFTTVSVTYDNP